MKIYTKGGDAGQTGLFGGARIPKDDQRLATYGTFDELNAVLGLAVSGDAMGAAELRPLILRVQGELFQLGAELATPVGKSTGMRLVADAEVETMEREIDEWEKLLAPLKTFILPGGSPLAARLHLARTVSRRAERELITLYGQSPVRGEVLRYVNRLSDWLFVAARTANRLGQVEDVAWLSPKA